MKKFGMVLTACILLLLSCETDEQKFIKELNASLGDWGESSFAGLNLFHDFDYGVEDFERFEIVSQTGDTWYLKGYHTYYYDFWVVFQLTQSDDESYQLHYYIPNYEYEVSGTEIKIHFNDGEVRKYFNHVYLQIMIVVDDEREFTQESYTFKIEHFGPTSVQIDLPAKYTDWYIESFDIFKASYFPGL